MHCRHLTAQQKLLLSGSSGEDLSHGILTAKLKKELGSSGLCHISQQGQRAHDFRLAIHAALFKVLLQHAAPSSTMACQPLQASAFREWDDKAGIQSSAGLAVNTGQQAEQKTTHSRFPVRSRLEASNGGVGILTQAACVLCC